MANHSNCVRCNGFGFYSEINAKGQSEGKICREPVYGWTIKSMVSDAAKALEKALAKIK